MRPRANASGGTHERVRAIGVSGLWERLAIGLLWLVLLPGLGRAELSMVEQFPATEAPNVCADTPLRLTFNEAPALGNSARVLIIRLKDGSTADVIEAGTASFTNLVGGHLQHYHPIVIDGNTAIIWPHAHALAYGEGYRAEIEAGVLKDSAGNDVKGVGGGMSWRF
jgi:hypothetical protein